VIAWQQYYAAKVMIAVYTSRLTEMSTEANRFLEASHQPFLQKSTPLSFERAEIIGPTRYLCSICFSCDEVDAEINGTHLMAWCGQYFTGNEEQRRLVAYLKAFMERVKWPNKTYYERLEHIWSRQRRFWNTPQHRNRSKVTEHRQQRHLQMSKIDRFKQLGR
jgi:hypothetical protein